MMVIHCVTNEESTTIMDFNPRSMKEIETKGVEVKAKQRRGWCKNVTGREKEK